VNFHIQSAIGLPVSNILRKAVSLVIGHANK
jgi:hypothetical protein